MNPNAIEAQVREILNSRLSLGSAESASTALDSPGVSQFHPGDTIMVRNSFVEKRSYKNEHQLAFDSGLRLNVNATDLVGNLRVNTVDNRWTNDKWITTANFGHISKKPNQISGVRTSRSHSRSKSLTIDSSLSARYSNQDLMTPRSPVFGEPPSVRRHSRHHSDAGAYFSQRRPEEFNLPEHNKKGAHRRVMSNKEDLRNRIRNALKKRDDVESGGRSGTSESETFLRPERQASIRDRSRTQEEEVSPRNIPPPPRQKPAPIRTQDPRANRLRQRDEVRTPDVITRNQGTRNVESVSTPRNAVVSPPSRVNPLFAEAKKVSTSSSNMVTLSKKTPERRKRSSVVFCDCDGVLNTAYTEVSDDGLPLDPVLVDRVVKLCKESGANLVLTSTWREDRVAYGKLFRTFQERGVTVLGRTPSLGSRSLEVLAWLRHNQRHVRHWVVLDDRMDLFTEKYNMVAANLVLTDEDEGITDMDVSYAKTILCPDPIPSAVKRKRIGNIDIQADSESSI